MNQTIEKLVAEFGANPGVTVLRDRGWTAIDPETGFEPKPEYTTGSGYNTSWDEGFAELTDGRIVYRGRDGDVLLFPDLSV